MRAGHESVNADASGDGYGRAPDRGRASSSTGLLRLPEPERTVSVLVAEEDQPLRDTCAAALRVDGYDVVTASTGEDALALLRRRAFDIAVLHQRMPRVDGSALLRSALLLNPEVLVIMTTAAPSVLGSIDVLREGAWDYLPKPFSAASLLLLAGRGAHTVLSRRASSLKREGVRLVAGEEAVSLVGSTPSFRRAVDLAAKVAFTDASVFITGESGSGKEMFAQYIHQMSPRAGKPFVAVNCAALPETLLESEMFGHCKGAFTGAVRDKPGLLEMADGGTLFLDELVEMPKSSQAKLLRVIQDGIVRRVGSEKTDAVVNVRFIAATNGDPEQFVARGDLREDLFYRLRVVRIHLPPLRQRPADIPVLGQLFLERFWQRHRAPGATPPTFSDAARGVLAAHVWRGNVRELQNVIENISVLSEPAQVIEPGDLLMLDEAGEEDNPANVALAATTFEEPYHDARDRVLALFETRYLTSLVGRAKGNMSSAARLAGVDRTTLYRLMDRHGLHRTPSKGLLSPVTGPA